MTISSTSEQIFDLIVDRMDIQPERFNSSDIFLGNGMHGDDAFDFIEEFATKFSVNLDDYRWYFHHGEEGLNWGGYLLSAALRSSNMHTSYACEPCRGGDHGPVDD